MTILIVDDDPSVARFLRILLETNGNAAEAVPDGGAALARIGEAPFDLVLLDRGLPDGDGIGILERVRELDEDVPVVLLTGWPDPRIAAEAIGRGAWDCLAKPVDVRDLLEVVAEALQNSPRAARPAMPSAIRSELARMVSVGGTPPAVGK